MDEKRMPMEAEVQELYVRMEPCPPEDFYGTSCRPRTYRSHTGIWVCLGMLVIAMCTASVVASFGHVRLIQKDGRLLLSMGAPEQTQAPETPIRNLQASAGSTYLPQSATSDAELKLELDAGRGEVLSPEQIYRQTTNAVVCIQSESFYGSAVCTGVVISSDGYILSAGEELSNAVAISVQFADGSSCTARRVGYDRGSRVCLLKIEAQGLPSLRFSDGKDLAVGQTAYCIANPYGGQIQNVFYEGMLCALQTLETDGEGLTILQTTAQLDSVGWGCPVLDGTGKVVGITTPIGSRLLSRSEDPCFAVSSADLVRIVSALELAESAENLWLGLEVESIPEETLYYWGYPGSLWISSVTAGTAPYDVLFPHDVITAVDEIVVSKPSEFQQLISAHNPGDLVSLTIFRLGRWYKINLPVMSR